MPNLVDQKVVAIGIVTVPRSASAWKTRSASAGVLAVTVTCTPSGFA